MFFFSSPIGIRKTFIDINFTNSCCNWGCLDSSAIQLISHGYQSGNHISFISFLHIPKSFCQTASSWPQIIVQSAFTVHFSPQASFSAQNSRFIESIRNRIEIVNVFPTQKCARRVSPYESESSINVKFIV